MSEKKSKKLHLDKKVKKNKKSKENITEENEKKEIISEENITEENEKKEIISEENENANIDEDQEDLNIKDILDITKENDNESVIDDDLNGDDENREDENFVEQDLSMLDNTVDDLSKNFINVKIISDNKRITSNILTSYEYASILGIRSVQIEQNPQIVFVEIGDLRDPVLIAKKEIWARKCPLKIIRKLNETNQEHWSPNEMILPVDYSN
jgi:DNA-directed RNA polymerase subunit K/omega